MGKDSPTPGVLLRIDHTKSKVYNALRRLEWQTNREVDKAVNNLMASSNKGGVDSTQFKAKKTVFRESQKLDGGQQVQAVMAGWKCSTYQYLGSMQMKGVGSSMFQKPFWKNNPDLNEDKVHRQINKQVKATVWMAHDYPLKLKHIMPALEILSVRDDMAARLRSVLSLAGIPQEGFPVKVSVPLMMTVKAVVTFENFRSDGIDASNFVIPSDYHRSRRMSKEKYIAGVGTGGEGGGGGGGGRQNMDRGASGNFESDDEEEEEEEGVFVTEAGVSERELLRRRAASRNAFDDDEEDDSDFDEDDMSDEGTTPASSPRRRKSLTNGNGSGTNGEMSDPQSPLARGQPTSQAQALVSGRTAPASGGGLQGYQPAAPSSDGRGREDPSQRSQQRQQAHAQPRGRSMSSDSPERRGGPASGTAGGGAAERHVGGGGEAPAHKRQRSKSRSGRLVSQLRGIVGAGKGKSARRGGGSGALVMNGRGGHSLSDDDEEDSFEDEEWDVREQQHTAGNGNAHGNGGGGSGSGGVVTAASRAAQLVEAREASRGHRRVSSATATMGVPIGNNTNLENRRSPPGSMSNLRAAAEQQQQQQQATGSRLPRVPPAMPLSGSRGAGVGRGASGRGSALKPPAPRNSE
ncbi:conserved unknown protein [Ectocarpus siliculosus]|uniref:Ankyrin repeat domain-containing protein n=1 Tax=Ectocarpus siliculosus TaxID=2880 RepID=D7FKT2_ECTSI|nr:conserved unknown protein [Ectocarpus siliculosus]|eukprot:CBJ29477.1 conserved unknown protein [Ectocarpus siliculosus]